MARIYQTRNLIDPSIIQYVGNRADKNLAYSNAQTERNANAVANMIKPLGGLADMGVRAYNTRDLIDENRPDPFLNAARNEYIWTGNTQPIQNWQNNQIQMWNTLKNAELQQASQKWHSDVQDREKQAGWERGRQQAENMLSYIETALSKDPNNEDLKRQKAQNIADANFYRTKLGMSTIENINSQNTSEQQVSEQTVTTPVEKSPYEGLSNDDLVKLAKDELDPKLEWNNEREAKVNEIVSKIQDPTLKNHMETEIRKKGKTKERKAEDWKNQVRAMNDYMTNPKLDENGVPIIPKEFEKFMKVNPAYGGWQVIKVGEW